MKLRLLLGTIVLAVTGSRLATAACPGDVNYTGPAGGLWNTPGNWDTNAAPTGAQAVCIPAGKGTITIGAGVAAAAKDITAASGLAIAATGSLSISDSSSALPFPNSVGDLSIASGGTLTSAGSGVSIAGQAVVDGSLASMATLVSGTLSGTGTIGGHFDNKGGTVRPGGAGVVGTLAFGSRVDQEATGTLEIDLASDVSFDQINGPSNNNIFLDGTIVANLLGGYTPADGTTWAFIQPHVLGAAITSHVQPTTFTVHSISMGAELEFHPGSNTTTTIATTTTSIAITTTTAAATSTTTTSQMPATTTSTSTTPTTQTSPVTTTTIPAACGGPSAPTFASIDCRLDALIAELSATPDVPAKLKAALMKNLQKARDKKQQAEQGTKITRAILGKLQKARRQMITFSHHIRSLAGRRAIHGGTGPVLAAAGDDISTDLRTLRDSLRGK